MGRPVRVFEPLWFDHQFSPLPTRPTPPAPGTKKSGSQKDPFEVCTRGESVVNAELFIPCWGSDRLGRRWPLSGSNREISAFLRHLCQRLRHDTVAIS